MSHVIASSTKETFDALATVSLMTRAAGKLCRCSEDFV